MADRGVRHRVVLLGLLAVLLGVGTLMFLSAERQLGPAEARAQALAGTLDRTLQRPAVFELPGIAVFAPDTTQADAELAGLAELLCDSLAGVLRDTDSLRVPSCTSTRAAAQVNVGGVHLAHLLGVDFAIAGRLARTEDDSVVATLELTDLHRNTRAWSVEERFRGEGFQPLLERVQTRVLRTTGVDVSAEPVSTLDAALYAKYLRATQLVRQRNVAQFREALALLDEVLEEAPDYSPALYARQGLTSMLLSFPTPGEPPKTPEELLAEQARMLEETRRLGEQLLAADPDDWRGHTLLLNHSVQNRAWRDGFRHADAISRGNVPRAGGLRINARLHLYAGYIQRGSALARRAAHGDPLDPDAYRVLAMAAGLAGDDGAVRDFAAIARELGVQDMHLFDAMLARRVGDQEGFVASFTAWLQAAMPGQAEVDTLARAIVDPALRDAALELLEQVEPGIRIRRSGFFLELALMGETRRSLDAVLHFSQQPPAGWVEQLWWPELSAVRQHPDFLLAMEQLGLLALWDVEGAPDACERRADGAWRCS